MVSTHFFEGLIYSAFISLTVYVCGAQFPIDFQ